MNRNLWLFLFASIAILALVIAQKAGRVYSERPVTPVEVSVLCTPDVAGALTAVSSAFMQGRPDVAVRCEAAELAANGTLGPPAGRQFDIRVTLSTAGEGNDYSVTISESARHPRAAQAWLDYLATPGARDLMRRHGLSSATPAEE